MFYFAFFSLLWFSANIVTRVIFILFYFYFFKILSEFNEVYVYYHLR